MTTGAGKLPFRALIHVVGINMLWRASERSIRDSVLHAMARAEALGVRSIAFPVIGAGSGGFDAREAERIMREAFAGLDSEIEVVIVRFKRAHQRP